MAGKNLVMVVESGPIRHAVLEAGIAPSAVAVVDPIMAELINWRKCNAFCFALCLLISLCASANAAAREYHHISRYFVVRPSLSEIPSDTTPGGKRIYRDGSVPGGLRTEHDEHPAYDDPSKFGGG